MDQFKNIHKGKRCFILGNGPSLKDFDFSILEDEITFGTNRIYLSGFTPTYYACVNNLVLEQYWDDIVFDVQTTKFISDTNSEVDLTFLPDETAALNIFPLDTSLRAPTFSSPKGPIWEGHTVTYVCLQLAYYMGFSEVILLGVDHYYGQERRPNMEVVATGPDQHHFHPDYFSGGVRWHTPDLRMSEFAYTLAKHAFEKDGRRIINCTSTTKLDIFEKMPLNHALRTDPLKSWVPRVSAIVSAYHAEPYLDGCLYDLLAQTEKPEAVVICQSGSKEHEIVENHVANCVVVTTDDIPTIYKAWNLGVQAAHGEYLTNANTDDRHHPHAYEIMSDYLDARPEIDVVYHDSYISWIPNQTFEEFIQDNQGKKLKPGRFQDEPGIFSYIEYERGKLAEGCFMGPQPMWRANLHQRHGLFLEHYKSAGDYEFWLRVAGEKNMAHIPLTLGLYHARLDGAELSDPELSAEESYLAINLHQTPEISLTPLQDGTVRVGLGGHWCYVKADELKKFAGEI